MPLSSWGDVAESLVAPSESLQDAGATGLHSWASVAEDADPSCVAQSGLSAWASCAEPLPPLDDTHAPEIISIEPMCLADFAEPKKKRRGRPPAGMSQGALAEIMSLCNAGDCVSASMDGTSDKDTSSSFVRVPKSQARVETSGMLVPKGSSFMRASLHGFRPLSLCSDVLRLAVQRFSAGDGVNDETYLKVKAAYVDVGKDYHECSLAVRSQMLAVDKNELSKKLTIYAAGEWVFSQMQKRLLEQELVQNIVNGDLICYIEYQSYDETPLHTRVLEKLPGGQDLLEWQAADSQCQGKGSNASVQLSLCSDSPTVKVLQCKQMYALVFRSPSGVCSIYGEVPTPLAALEKNSAPVLAEALSRLCASSSQSESFRMKTRMSSMDKAAANVACESAFTSCRNGWTSLQSFCEVHITARAFRKCFDQLMGDDISGIIHIALALRSGAAMINFRKCLVEEIRAKLKLYFGPVPSDAITYREKMLNLFLNSGSKILVNRMLLSKLPNGLWSVRDEVQVFLPLELQGQVSKATVSKSVVAALTYVLTGTKPHLFPRHRWTGCDLAVEELGRLECVHYLLSATWGRFMASHSKVSTASSLPKFACTIAEEAEHEVHGGSSVYSGTGAAAFHARYTDEHASHLSEVPEGLASEKQRGSMEHAQDRQKGDAWLRSEIKSPLTVLVLLRTAMQPLLVLLNSQLDLASLDWELKQQAAMAMQLKPDGAEIDLVHRHYQATVAAEGMLEQQHLQAVQELFEMSWDLVEERQLHVATRALAFQLLSRQGALVFVGLTLPHVQFPVRLFKLLHHPGMASELCAEAIAHPCMLDGWTAEMLRLYPTFEEQEFMHVLEAHATLFTSNTAVIEARHSSVRRTLMSRNQTWAMPFANLSAEFFALQLRRNEQAAGKMLGCGHGIVSTTRKRKLQAHPKFFA
eukprot:2930043-Amphidinium_carterae.5